MAEEKQAKLEKLYSKVAPSAQLPKPKHTLLSWKCPKCGNKLSKDSVKDFVFSGEGSSEFAKKVVSDAGYAPGLYSLKIEALTCNCGYEYATAILDSTSE